jgi:hypothetical protein
MLSWQTSEPQIAKAKSGKNLSRIIFNPLEKVFPRKMTDPSGRLKTSSDFKAKLAIGKNI